MIRRRTQDRRRERGHHAGQPEPEHGDSREHVPQVGRVRADPQREQQAACGNQRPDRHGQAGTGALGQRAGPGGQQKHQRGDG